MRTTNTNIASKAKKRGKPWDEGWIRDFLDHQRIKKDARMTAIIGFINPFAETDGFANEAVES